MKHYIVWACAVTSMTACAPKSVRTEYVLDRFGDLLVTNSPSFDAMAKSGEDGHGIAFDYAFIVRNVGKAEARLLADQASLKFEDKTVAVTCVPADPKSPVVFQPGSSLQLTCPLKLVPDSHNKLAIKDALLLLTVPYRQGESSGEIQFKVISSRENFK